MACKRIYFLPPVRLSQCVPHIHCPAVRQRHHNVWQRRSTPARRACGAVVSAQRLVAAAQRPSHNTQHRHPPNAVDFPGVHDALGDLKARRGCRLVESVLGEGEGRIWDSKLSGLHHDWRQLPLPGVSTSCLKLQVAVWGHWTSAQSSKLGVPVHRPLASKAASVSGRFLGLFVWEFV